MADNCKFQKTQYQVSYDSGTTWQDVIPAQYAKGELIEYDSPDCTSVVTLYRWRALEGQYLCDGNSKYTKEIQEESYNNGITWYTSYPTIYRGGEYVGEDAEFCCDKFVGHYIYLPTPTCPSGYYWNGVRCVRSGSGSGSSSGGGTQGDVNNPMRNRDPLKVVKCNGNGTLTTAATNYYTSNYVLYNAEIGDSVTIIGASAFTRTRLETIEIPSGVTSIGNRAFYGSSALTSCTINAVVPPTLGTSVFTNTASNLKFYVPCGSVGAYILADGWNNFASRINGIPPCETPTKFKAYYSNGSSYSLRCDSDSTLTSGNTKPSGYVYQYMTNAEIGDCVTSIGNNAFTFCGNLKSVVIPNNVTSIGNSSFSSCKSLTSIEIPDSVTSIGQYAFQYCSAMTSCIIGSGVTSISEGTFGECSGLTRLNSDTDGVINIPTSVTSIGQGAFSRCTSLTSIVIPTSVTSIDHYAFYNCSALTSCTINAITPPTLGVSVFENTASNLKIYVPCESVSAYKVTNRWSTYASRIEGIPPCGEPSFNGKFKAYYSDRTTYTAACDSSSELTTATTRAHSTSYAKMLIAEIGECITSIGIYAFDGCQRLTSIEMPNTLTSIGRSAFYECSGLTSIDIPSSVTSIGQSAFYFCSGLTSIVIPDSVTSIGEGAFSNCWGLSSCTIGSGVTNIGYAAFGGCTGLTSITCLATTPPILGDYGWGNYVFNNTNNCPIYVPCASVSVYKAASGWSTYASRIQGIPPCVTPIKFSAEYRNGTSYSADCDSSTTLTTGNTHPNGYTYTAMTSASIGDCITSIGTSAFTNCTNLSAITIPNTVTTIGERSFYGCSGLTNIDMPSGLTVIGSYAFQHCSGLTSVEMPSSIRTISASAFYNCNSLTSITVNATTPPALGANAFLSTNNCPIYVLAASLNTYKSASGWSTYTDRIQAIPT